VSTYSRLSRRAFLAGLGGAALASPLLSRFGLPDWVLPVGTAAAQPAGGPPLRLIIMWHPNGSVPEAWGADGTERDFSFRPILAPLEAIKQDVVVLDGINALSAYHGPGDAHQRATGQCLTGTELQEGGFEGAEGRSSGWANAASLDQVIGRHVGKTTRFSTLEYGVFNAGANSYSRISFSGPGAPLPPENSPRKMFERLYGDPTISPEDRALAIAQRRSVLDAVAARYSSAKSRLGVEDQKKIDAHLTTVREIEQRLDLGNSSCEAPAAPDYYQLSRFENIPVVGRQQMDLLVSSMRCDLTRVATLMFMNSATDKQYPWLGIRDAHHALSHAGSENEDARDKLIAIYRWYAEQFVYLVRALKAVPEGNGTMLDNTLVVWVSEHSEGNIHDRYRLPYVLAGGAKGQLRTGRLLKLARETPHNDLWVSVMNMFGLETRTFGNPQFCNGPLAGLT
jgi:hypothetical protein